ncbi:succinate dehydrogenase cytochrome b subunit [Blattabacterium cuenoti]|uniref:succinate dehydrogenase cytochrome b subunit n=1 Tax=Blattabacterium cuenoti TaxID=1653831 RepID=UPI00163CC99F|nr:succinate dehydrogenase cytochrome b subunit [Blattabacterium cuenoti]
MFYSIFFKSSIGKKIIMASTGVFLMIFLLLHLSINLSLFYGEKTFNEAVFFMRNNIFIHIMEYILAIGFITHIFLGINIFLKNKNIRGDVEYSLNKSTPITSFSSRTMIISGILILCFLILHLINFSIPMKYSSNKISDYKIVISLFKNPYYTFIYVFSFIMLGIHLNHGFQSSFYSLGIANKKNFIWIKKFGCFYFWFISIGFSIIAIWFFFN